MLDFPVHFNRGERGEIRAVARDTPAGYAEARLEVDDATLARWRMLGQWAPSYVPAQSRHVHTAAPPESTRPETLGSELFSRVFAAPIRSLWDESRGRASGIGSGLRLRLHFDLGSETGRALAACPWELLYRPETRSYLALDPMTPIARYYDVPRAAELQLPPFPLRIGLILASPTGLSPLALERERRRIEEALAGRPGIEVIACQGAADEVRTMVRDAGCHILHYMGHADVDPSTGEGFLAAEQRDGSLCPLSARDLADLVRSSAVRMVVLNACRTGEVTSLDDDLYETLVPSLTLAGVPAVVSMTVAIQDDAAIRFSQGFYPAIARGCPVDAALTEARLVMRCGAAGHQWMVPALHLRGCDAHIFKPEPTSESPAPESRRLLARGRAAIAEKHYSRAQRNLSEALADGTGFAPAEAELCFAKLAQHGVSNLALHQVKYPDP